MPISNSREYECSVVHEQVKICLSTQRSFGFRSKETLYVKCNQTECQYADKNLPPCPLCLDMFKIEIQEREERARVRREDLDYRY